MKTPIEILERHFQEAVKKYPEENWVKDFKMAGDPTIEFVTAAMEEYAEQFRQAAVSGSVCQHEFTEPRYGRESEFLHYECHKCGQTDS
jgi:hypothetical protein